jgi:hypothetical protein
MHVYCVLWELSLSAGSTNHEILAAADLRELLYLADLDRSLNLLKNQQVQIDFRSQSSFLMYHLLESTV